MSTIRTTMNVDEELLAKAAELLPGRTRTAVVEEALRVLVAREAARRLIELGGSMPDAEAPPRRRFCA